MIHFFLSIMYADPQEIGLDPTILMLDDGRYDIEMLGGDGQSRTYRTLALVSDSGAKPLHGKGTRVWTAVRMENGHPCGEPVALKDSWVDPARSPEGTIFEQMCKADRPPEYQRLVDSLFIPVECHGDVHHCIDNDPLLDYTPSCNLVSGFPPTPFRNRDDLLELAHSLESGLEAKIHYRIVFKETCRSLHDETSLAVVFSALERITLGLYLVFQDDRSTDCL